MMERIAYLIDLYRVFPRIFLIGYGVLCWDSALWFMALKDPSNAQSAFVTLLAGFFVPLTNFYLANGVNWGGASKSVTTTATVTTAPPTTAGQ